MPYPFAAVEVTSDKTMQYRANGVVSSYQKGAGVAHFEFDKTAIDFHENNASATAMAAEELMDYPVEPPPAIDEHFDRNMTESHWGQDFGGRARVKTTIQQFQSTQDTYEGFGTDSKVRRKSLSNINS